MKKILSILLVLALVLSITACGNTADDQTEEVSLAETETETASDEQEEAETVSDDLNEALIKSDVVKTPSEAIADMTWGVNLVEPYIADIDRPLDVKTAGYYKSAPLNIAIWFWNQDFDWISFESRGDSFTASVAVPDFKDGEEIDEWVGGLFRIAVLSYGKDQRFGFTFSDSKLVLQNGSTISLDFLNGSYENTTSEGPDDNGWYRFDVDFDKSALPDPDAELNGAVLEIQVTVDELPVYPPEEKVAYFFEYGREAVPQEEMTDIYLEQGVNVFRLPVTWTYFVDDETFQIDEAWLKAVKSEVDYILSKDAYCILDMHNDYMTRSYVGDHWEIRWMNEEYRDYVDARFAAVWKQIAEYFKDYSRKLIFETCNEPAMEWYEGIEDYKAYMESQTGRVNELNQLFTDTVRKTGGKNENRLLCMAVAEFNQYQWLGSLSLPEDDYLIVQLHSYNAMEDDITEGDSANYDYMAATDALFQSIEDFTNETGVPVLIGEVGITHQLPAEEQLRRVTYYFEQAAEHHVPCLWWEDFFYTDDNSCYWLYDKHLKEWGRMELLNAIKNAVGK